MSKKLNRENLRMVVVEDDPNDFFLLERALKQAGFTFPLVHLDNGLKAIDYFSHIIQSNSSLPDLVLMDIKMPIKDGLEVLEWLRHQTSLAGFPVIMLSSSDHLQDVRKSQRLGIYHFVTKRVHYQELIFTLESFLDKRNGAEEN